MLNTRKCTSTAVIIVGLSEPTAVHCSLCNPRTQPTPPSEQRAESIHSFDVLKFKLKLLVWSHRFVYFGCILGKRDEGGNNFGLFGPDDVHFGERHCCVMLVYVRKIEL